ncbi:MAG: C40 family peptidase, partial [Gemmatimonas sp.]
TPPCPPGWRLKAPSSSRPSPCLPSDIVTFVNHRLLFRVALAGALAVIPALAEAQSMSTVKKPFAAFSASAQSLRDSVVSKARGQLGTRYRLGASTPGKALDCSSLVKYVMGALDFVLPRTARQQAQEGESVPRDLAALMPGDLLTFGKGKQISHIGIYVGNNRMVHASTSRKSVIEIELKPNNPLIKQWMGVRRIVADRLDFRDSLVAIAETIKP